MGRDSGFTLIEFLVTLTILGIVTVWAVPSYQTLSGKSILTAHNQAFTSDLLLARNTAITRNKRVVMCKRNGSDCTTVGGWEQGWIVFVDDGKSGVLDQSDQIIRWSDNREHGITIKGNTNVRNRIIFKGNGSMSGSNGKLVFCDKRISIFERDKAMALVLILANSGRFKTIPGNEDSSLTSCDPG